MELPKRKHPRLKNYDYSSNGYYFITFSVENPKVKLSTVGLSSVGRGLDPAVAKATVTLTDYGKIVKKNFWIFRKNMKL